MADLSIIYLTDGSLEDDIRSACVRYLYRAAGDAPIISASQGPCDVGKNVNLGPIGRSGLNMYKQIMAALELVDTKYVAIAEHDCIYSLEHFAFRPPDDQFYWYNTNCWLLQYKNDNHPEYDGMFSFLKDRAVQSQLICTADALREVTKVQIDICARPEWNKVRSNMPVGEPGTLLYEHAMKITNRAKSIRMIIRDFINNHQARTFATTIPNVDIRHGNNFTGQRRGKNRRFELEPYGTMNDILNIWQPQHK